MGDPFCYIHVTVKPHIKKYIQYQYRNFTHVRITKRNFIGRKLYDLLSESKKIRYGGPENKTDCTIAFVLTQHQMIYRSGVYLTEKSTTDFNQFVESFFYKDLYDFIEMDPADQKIKTLIEKFCQKLGISENEITYDALIKSYQRHQESIKIAEEFKVRRGEFSYYELKKMKKQKC